MDLIFVVLIALVICSGAVATAAVLYAIALRAKAAEIEAEVAALELERAEREAAKPDPYDLLELEWASLKSLWHRHGQPFTLALLDMGDALRPQASLPEAVVARAMAAVKQALRAEDSCFQLDSRTAAVLLACSSTEGGWAFVDRLRRILGNEPIAHEGGTSYLDVRVGVAEWSIKLHDLPELIDAAQRARKDFSGEIQEQRGDFLPGPRGAATDA